MKSRNGRAFQDKSTMARQVPLGAQGEAEQTVEFRHTLTARHPELPAVYSTPDMIGLMEVAAYRALQPFCEEGEVTLGTAINIEHRAATTVGDHIQAKAVVEAFDGRFYTLRVSARQGEREIGRGTVARAVVNVGKFMERLNRENHD
jgi:predicted thioesterase